MRQFVRADRWYTICGVDLTGGGSSGGRYAICKYMRVSGFCLTGFLRPIEPPDVCFSYRVSGWDQVFCCNVSMSIKSGADR